MSNVLGGSYFPSIQGSTFNVSTTYQATASRGFERLSQAVSPNAFHNSDDRPDPPKCHENTRVTVINKIMDWVTGKIDTDAFMLWLYGPAGAGKSAIARTIAELCEARKLLLASFFFFRSDSKRNTVTPLVANIAYRIACEIPGARERIDAVIDTDPHVLSYSLEVQLTRLVLEPLQYLSAQAQNPLPPLIVIDGLDECLDRDAQIKLIRHLSSSVARFHLSLKFLIASRPEQHLKPAFAAVSSPSRVSRLELNNDFNPDEDVCLFLNHKFGCIKVFHPFCSAIPSDWPKREQMDTLVRKASGQFIYASIVARFVDSPYHSPPQRLDIVLGLRPPIHHDLPFAELDTLYTFIISNAEDPDLVLRIIGTSAALKSSPTVKHLDEIEAIEDILGLDDNGVHIALSALSSLLEVREIEPERPNAHQIAFHHSSFLDFLSNLERSKGYYVDVQNSHGVIVQWICQAFTSCEHSASQTLAGRLNLLFHLGKSSWDVELEGAFVKFSFGHYLDYHVQFYWPSVLRDDMTKRFFDYLKATKKLELHHHHSVLYLDYVISSIKSRPGPEKFLLLSTVWFVLQKPFKSCLSTRSFPCQDDPYPVWSRFCAALFGFHSTEIDWDTKHWHLACYPTNYDRRRTSLEPLAGIYGNIAEAKGDSTLSYRLACVAISCMQYLCHGNHNAPPRQNHLRTWAMKSKQSPWIWRRRMRVTVTRWQMKLTSVNPQMRWSEEPYSFPQSLRQPRRVLHSKGFQSEEFYQMARKFYVWALDLLYRTLRKAGKSDELTEALSKSFIPWPAPLLYPRHVKRVRKATEVYLEKFDSYRQKRARTV